MNKSVLSFIDACFKASKVIKVLEMVWAGRGKLEVWDVPLTTPSPALAGATPPAEGNCV